MIQKINFYSFKFFLSYKIFTFSFLEVLVKDLGFLFKMPEIKLSKGIGFLSQTKIFLMPKTLQPDDVNL